MAVIESPAASVVDEIPQHRRRPFGRWFRESGWRHIVGLLALVFALFPLVFVLSASVNTSGNLTGSTAIFQSFTLDNYEALFGDPSRPYGRWFMNTMVIGAITAAGTVFLCAIAAYAFSRFRFSGRRAGLLGLILLQMFPQLLAYIAIFALLSAMEGVFPAIGLDSQLGLIMVYLGGALGVNTFLMYGFFNTVPRELDESAKIDGAGHARIFFGIILRLVTPILIVIGLLSFIATLNEFLIASLVLQDPDKQTLAVGLYKFVSQRFAENWGVFTAGAVLGAIPVVLLFQFLQKYIVGGLTAGAVKG
jgi:arabinogalactan oligomer/maltooligosaccharide transport system permease protein